jgi:hypothetical protein
MDINLALFYPKLLAVQGYIDSDEEIDPKTDKVIGELPNSLKAVYTLLKLAEGEMRQAVISSEREDYSKVSDEEVSDMGCDICMARSGYQSLRALFRTLARREFNLLRSNCCPSLGVRKGFLLVRPAGQKVDRDVKHIDIKVDILKYSSEYKVNPCDLN